MPFSRSSHHELVNMLQLALCLFLNISVSLWFPAFVATSPSRRQSWVRCVPAGPVSGLHVFYCTVSVFFFQLVSHLMLKCQQVRSGQIMRLSVTHRLLFANCSDFENKVLFLQYIWHNVFFLLQICPFSSLWLCVSCSLVLVLLVSLKRDTVSSLSLV